MSHRDSLIREIAGAIEQETIPFPGETMSLADIEKRLEAINQQVGTLIALAANENDPTAYQGQLKELLDEVTTLKAKRAFIQEQREKDTASLRRIESAVAVMEQAPSEIVWDEGVIRQLVEMVKVVSKDKIIVRLRGGVQIEQEISE